MAINLNKYLLLYYYDAQYILNKLKIDAEMIDVSIVKASRIKLDPFHNFNRPLIKINENGYAYKKQRFHLICVYSGKILNAGKRQTNKAAVKGR